MPVSGSPRALLALESMGKEMSVYFEVLYKLCGADGCPRGGLLWGCR